MNARPICWAVALMLTICLSIPAQPPLSQKGTAVDAHGDPLPPWAFARLGTVRFRATGTGLGETVYAPDGKTLACAADREVIIWDAATGKEVQRLNDDGWRIDNPGYSPDGKLLATWPWGGDTVLWDATTGKVLRRFSGGWCSFSRDGKMLVTATDYGGLDDDAPYLRLYEAATGKLLGRFRLPSAVNALALAPDGRTAAIISRRDWNRIAIWNIHKGCELLRSSDYNVPIKHLVYAPDGKALISVDDSAVCHWDPATGKLLRQWRCNVRGGRAIAFSPHGKLLAWASDNGLRVYKIGGNRPPRPLGEPSRHCYYLAFSPDSKTLAYGNTVNLRFCDVATGREIRRFPGHASTIRSATFTPAGRTLVTTAEDGTILWDLATLRERRHIAIGTHPDEEQVTVSADGRLLVLASKDGTVRLLDLATETTACRLEGKPGYYGGSAFTSDGKLLAWQGNDGAVFLYDSGTGKLLRTIGRFSLQHYYLMIGLRFSPDGKLLQVSLPQEGERHAVYETATGRPLEPFGQRYHKCEAAFSPDGKLLAMEESGTVRLWDLAAGRELPRLRGTHGALREPFFSPDGRYVGAYDHILPENVGADDHPFILLWDRTTSRRLPQFGVKADPQYASSFSPDGKTLVVLGPNNVVRLWEVASGESRGQFVHEHRCEWLPPPVFTPDGRTLAIISGTSVLLRDMTGLRRNGRREP